MTLRRIPYVVIYLAIFLKGELNDSSNSKLISVLSSASQGGGLKLEVGRGIVGQVHVSQGSELLTRGRDLHYTHIPL